MANNHKKHNLLAFSPITAGQAPLVFHDNPISLGSFQVIKTRIGEHLGVDLDIIRFRYTPAKGKVYGPPQADIGLSTNLQPGSHAVKENETDRLHTIVLPENRILNAESSWFQKYVMDNGLFMDPQPQDSYDGANTGNNASWGIVDDTCDVIIEAIFSLDQESFVATARAFSGPPDFAPDRRPFISVADDLADRDLPKVKVNESLMSMTENEIVDLFERIYETSSLMNLDGMRYRALWENITEKKSKDTFLDMPHVDKRSFTLDDQPFVHKSPELLLSKTASLDSYGVNNHRLPYSAVSQFLHSQFIDRETLLSYFKVFTERIVKIIRPPFPKFKDYEQNPNENAHPNSKFKDPRILRDNLSDMRMPPYMRDSGAFPLSLTHRQYHMILEFIDLLIKQSENNQQDSGE